MGRACMAWAVGHRMEMTAGQTVPRPHPTTTSGGPHSHLEHRDGVGDGLQGCTTFSQGLPCSPACCPEGWKSCKSISGFQHIRRAHDSSHSKHRFYHP